MKLYPIITLAAALLLTGCATSRKSTTTTTTPAPTRSLVPLVNAQRVKAEALTAKLNLRVEAGGKKMSIGGNFRVRRDDVIQLQLVWFGIKEVGRLELTRDTLLILDRMNNQYLRVAYAQVPYLQRAGIDFYAFQSLFWGELFVPGGHGKAPEAKLFSQEATTDNVRLSHEDRNLALQFIAGVASGLLSETRVASATNRAIGLEGTYDEWTRVGQGQFPGRTTLSLATGGATPVTVTLQLSSIKANDKWETRTTVNTRKYRPVSVEQITKMIMKMAQ